MLKRIAVAAAAIAAAGLLGAGTAAQAQAVRPAPYAARPVLHAKVVNLHRAYLRALPHVRNGKISGIVYARGKQPKAAAKAAACTEPNCPVAYGGGPVQHTPHVYLLLWGPNWSSDPSQEASAAYLESFYAGLGVQPQDSWSTITTQYSDTTGAPSFSGSVFVGAFFDKSTPPTGTTQNQLATEADAFAKSQGITDLKDAQIVVATQSGTCPQGFAGTSCPSGGTYCAWHSSSNEPYINLPYLLDAGTACGKDFVNGTAGTDDGFSMVGGAEYAGTITDPIPHTGWWDASDSAGGEIGDKCAFGGPGGTDPYGDVTLSTGSFAMQSLWSNGANACVMSGQGGDTVTVTNPGNLGGEVGLPLKVQLNGNSTGKHPLTWSATGLPNGLGISPSTGLVSGTPSASGRYSVAVTAKDTVGASGSASFTWTIAPGQPAHAITGDHGKCLDDYHSLTTNGNKIDIYTCNGTGAQQWVHDPGSVLMVLGGCLTDRNYAGAGAKLVLWSCIGNKNELWTYTSSGEYKLATNGLCLTDPSGSSVSGTQVEIRVCHNFSDQKWSG